MSEQPQFKRVVLLAGGVGGARMARGLAAALPSGALTVIANIGDDDRFYNLEICPDLDTILYTLSGRVSAAQGWGVDGDTTRALETLAQLGAPAWMKLGDADFGLHIYRSWRLAQGERLTVIMREAAARFGVDTLLLPASDSAVPTQIRTDDGWLSFQDWFVRLRAAPAVRCVRYWRAEMASVPPEAIAALRDADAIVIAPSNPLLSIQPMLALAPLRSALEQSSAPCVAVSPLINGKAVKGPLGRMLADLGMPADNVGIADIYRGIADGLVIDSSDAADADALRRQDVAILTADTLIREAAPAHALARDILDWLPQLARRMPLPEAS